MNAILDLLTELFFDPNLGNTQQIGGPPRTPTQKERQYRGRRLYTREELEADRVLFRKSLAREDY